VHRYVFRVAEHRPRQFVGAVLTRRMIGESLARQLRAARSDTVHIQCVSANAWYARYAARRLGLPLVVTLQGELKMDATAVYQRSHVLPQLLTDLLSTADAVTACSRATLDEASEYCQVDLGERGHVIYNGVRLRDFEVTPLDAGVPYVLGIGRLVPQKGFDVLIRAFASLVSSFPHHLFIGGEGRERASLESLVEEMHLVGRVRFLGRVDRAAVPPLFRGASCFVLPSRHEPLGIVNIEAMAAGVPVIASRVGGVPELMDDGISGLLVACGDHEALAAKLRSVLGDGDLAARLGAGGLEAARAFDWSEIARRYEAIYRELAPLARSD
jgi:glycogen(starch) synthase